MLKSPLKVAVTGDIASGKSSVCLFLKEFGAYLVSADHIVHQLLSPSTSLGKQIIALLGKDVVNNTQFNRRAIAEKVFKDYSLLKSLEGILHPEVQKEIEKEYLVFQAQIKKKERKQDPAFRSNPQRALFVAEVPLLYESGLECHYDMAIFVTANPGICQKRFAFEHPSQPEEFILRTDRLISSKEKMQRANRVIQNNGTLEELKKSTKNLYDELTQNSG